MPRKLTVSVDNRKNGSTILKPAQMPGPLKRGGKDYIKDPKSDSESDCDKLLGDLRTSLLQEFQKPNRKPSVGEGEIPSSLQPTGCCSTLNG